MEAAGRCAENRVDWRAIVGGIKMRLHLSDAPSWGVLPFHGPGENWSGFRFLWEKGA